MNTNKTLLSLLTGVALIAFTGVAQADGTVASPKHRDVISGRAGIASAPAAKVNAMACPTCKNERVTRVDATARGAFKPTIVAVKHLCQGCETVTKTVGVGKAANDVTTHTCNTPPAGEPNCCAVIRKS